MIADACVFLALESLQYYRRTLLDSCACARRHKVSNLVPFGPQIYMQLAMNNEDLPQELTLIARTYTC